MDVTANIIDVQPAKAFYQPGEPVGLAVRLSSQLAMPAPARLRAVITHLADPIDQVQVPLTLTGDEQLVDLEYSPPQASPRGYGIDLVLESEAGISLATYSTAFDVLDRWTQTPRYGFLSDFPPGRPDAAETIANLTRFHLNGLQFYDWMYRHEQLLTTDEPYVDLLGRRLSRQTVDDLVTASHQRGVSAMPYTAVYGASLAFYEQHPDWALYTAGGKAHYFGDNFMVIMDPRPTSPWTLHLLDQFDQVLEQTEFDGIHLDQYGDPKEGYDAQGVRFNLAEPLADFINATKSHVQLQRPDGAVVFNAVTNWPVETVAPANQDLVYIEVWPPYTWFNDLHSLIVEARRLGDGKPVVLAAYVSPQHQHNVILMDAVIFSSGGGHIELGERNGLLADPYFPNYEVMAPDLAAQIQRMYDFSVRYQDIIGPRIADVTRDYQQSISLEGVSTAPNAMNNKVWPIVRQGDAFMAINLVNLVGVERPDWKELIPTAPEPLGTTTLRLDKVSRPVSRVWLATPDQPDLDAELLDFTSQNGDLAIQIPALKYWNLIVIEWGD